MLPSFFIIESASIFQLTGRDCARYLNARLSNNVRDLQPQRGLAAAALSPQGRTEFFGTVLKISAEEFYIISDGGNAGDNEKILLRYKVADRVECRLRADLRLIHVVPAASTAAQELGIAEVATLPEWQPVVADGRILYAHRRSPEVGVDVLCDEPALSVITASLRQASFKELDTTERLRFRIEAKRPAFPGELNDESIFLESGLTHAVSFTKGCYVGQEVVEKVDSHGRLPFTLTALVSAEATDIPATGDLVHSAEASKAGEVTAAARASDT